MIWGPFSLNVVEMASVCATVNNHTHSCGYSLVGPPFIVSIFFSEGKLASKHTILSGKEKALFMTLTHESLKLPHTCVETFDVLGFRF